MPNFVSDPRFEVSLREKSVPRGLNPSKSLHFRSALSCQGAA